MLSLEELEARIKQISEAIQNTGVDHQNTLKRADELGKQIQMLQGHLGECSFWREELKKKTTQIEAPKEESSGKDEDEDAQLAA